MALLRKNLVPVHVFNMVENDDVYVGTELVPEYSHTIKANVQPAENKIAVEAYGERVYNMLSVIAPNGTGLDERKQLSFGDGKETEPTHKIVSVKRYSAYNVILAEKVM